jgi:hypothetical protein
MLSEIDQCALHVQYFKVCLCAMPIVAWFLRIEEYRARKVGNRLGIVSCVEQIVQTPAVAGFMISIPWNGF